MTRRVLFASILVCGAPLVLAIDCQNLSPYPDVYDHIYEAGHQSPSPGNGTEPIDSGSPSDGEKPDDCPTGTTLVANTVTPQWVALDKTNVYWATIPDDIASEAGGTFGSTGAIQTVTRAGGSTTPTSLVSSLTGAIVVTTNNSYLGYSTVGPNFGSSLGSVGLVPIPTGSGASTPGTSLTSPAGVAIDSTNIYWVSNTGSSGLAIQSAPLSGGPAFTVATQSGYFGAGLAVDTASSTLYFTGYLPSSGSGGAVFSVATGGGTPTPLQTFGSGQPNDVRTDATNVYWDDKTGGGIYQMPLLGGGAIITLATGLTTATQLAVDSTNVYAVDEAPGGSVYEVAIGGGSAAKKLATTNFQLGGVAADGNDSSVYFSIYSANVICQVAK
jgi:hypothetical protein